MDEKLSDIASLTQMKKPCNEVVFPDIVLWPRIESCYLAKAKGNACLAPDSSAPAAPLLIFSPGTSSVIGANGWVQWCLLPSSQWLRAAALTQDQFWAL